jgi:hypothetical protein
MVMDENNRWMRMLCVGGLVVVALALGYTIGLRQRLDSPFVAMRSATITPDTITILQDAQQRAHEAGDVTTEEWLRKCAEEGRTQFFDWATAKAHGRRFSVVPERERHAASR